MDDNYRDIINMSADQLFRPRMSRCDRAAQFAPFAALSGFGAVINETSRLTDKKPELDGDSARLLNEQIKIIEKNIKLKPEIEIMFFVPDESKEGGSIQKIRGKIRRVDKFERELIFTDNTKEKMDDIMFIDGNFFKNIARE